ncbi:transcriptional corepressor LEUNIG_HOMOLOG-like isoform X2 [Phoenix dactylifera]|uniref:Transcriptional corepressor LEUNIG_HOMOLOG-like isoform X2 n=1 Tax=Phoenix dactylifera TaxID=42345 RepID=A0A8B7CMT8_PHODC|nr:transcriptional corepressor LEUNIG_HOMOLOG-like isoform X2 [Phoenix dactylifera]
MAQNNWEADKMLDVYIHDYLLKRNLQATAKAFMAEGKVSGDPVAIDAPGGFLYEWWSVFWDIFIARTNEKHSEVAAAYIEAQQIKAREQQQQQQQQQFQMQRLQLMQQQHPQMMRRDGNHPALNGTLNAINSDGMSGTPPATVLAAKMYEERMRHPHSVDSEASQQLLDARRMALLKSATNHPGQLVQGSPGSVSAALQHIQARSQQTNEIKSEMGVGQRSLPMDPSSLYGQGNIQAKAALGAAGLNQGVSGHPLKGWPLTGFDQVRPSLGAQVQKPFMTTQNQFQLFPSHQQQQFLAEAQAQTSLGSSLNYGEMDPRKFRALPRGGLNGKDGQVSGNDGSIGSPIQSNSPMVRQDQSEYLMKSKVAQMQQSSNQQQQELQQQQQLRQAPNRNVRKRKPPTSSGAANSTGTGNTVGPSPNSPPSTPSTHTPGDGVAAAGNLQHVTNMSKSLMMYGADGTGGLASSSNQMDDLEHFGDVGSLDDNVESFLSQEDGDARDIFAALKSFTFTEVSSIRTSNGKVVCCHFSSDGKLLASAGHEKKAVLWNMDTLQTESTPEEHSFIITDIRFRPNSTQLVTSSFDRTVRLWNAAEPNFSLHTFAGHSSQVTSLDFHPKKTDVFCSCDGNGEIRYWNVSQYSCSHVSKGGTAQVRFQPRIGHLLAAAAENVVSIIDVETDMKTLTLQGHNKEVHSVCWDANGDQLASVSQDSVKVWSLTSGECIHELSSNGNQFHTCIFHPRYPKLLIIGAYQTLELWNMAENQTMTVQAHEGLIADLAQSPFTGIVASVSHDRSVKIWK